MDKKILIDLSKFRVYSDKSCDNTPPEGFFTNSPNTIGFKSIREMAIFQFTCRKCEDAPCINVCPFEALEKDTEGMIHRHTNLCVSCKSCVAICPFGTMMSDFFKHIKNKDLFYDLSDNHELHKFIKACPIGAVSLVDMDENPDENIYKLNDQVLIKENIWSTEKQ
ncbi:MAG: 4Fe-4S binding protein [Bacteroidales bacterium]|jgi:Fe-S-cluster-containing hydrogenase component 2|nr:4Fe-4S binding protein [Bacteroidales bacterium]